jgi:hypothetical protein
LKKAVETSGNEYKIDGSNASAGYGANVIFTDGYTSSDGTTNTDSLTSKDITVVNKSTFDVDVKVTTKVTGLKTDDYEISLVDDTTADTVKGQAISLAISDTPATLQGTTETTDTSKTNKQVLKETSSYTYTVEAIANPDDAYEVKNTDGTYSYGLKNNVSTVAFNEVVLNISGSVNADADWSKFNAAGTKSLKLEVAYTVDKHSDETTISGSAYSVSSKTNKYTIAYASTVADDDKEITSIEMSKDGKGIVATVPAAAYSLNDDKDTLTVDGTLNTAIGNGGIGQDRYLIVTFKDSTKVTFKLDVTA